MTNAHEVQEHLLIATAALIRTAEMDATLDLPDIGLATAALADRGPLLDGEPVCPPLVSELLAEVKLPENKHLRAVLSALQGAAPTLRWFDPYSDRPDQAELRAGFFATAFVGDPERDASLTQSTTASVFVTVQAPNILYPPHSHLAPELYCAIAGTAEWKKGAGPFEPKGPGSWMVHSPWTSHAMQTRSEPLVALAIWTDDLDGDATLDD
jgi:hypothetical protein